MATSFSIKPIEGGTKYMFMCRVRSRVRNIDIKQETGITIDAHKWDKVKEDPDKITKFIEKENRSNGDRSIFKLKERIGSKLDAVIDEPDFDAKRMRHIIREIVHEDVIKAESHRREDENKVNIITFIDNFIEEREQGRKLTESGERFKERTLMNYKQLRTKLSAYPNIKGVTFDSINDDFYESFKAFLATEYDAMAGTIGTHIKCLKSVLKQASKKKLIDRKEYEEWSVSKEHRDAIYLTEEELERFKSVDLKGMNSCYDLARDIFLIGVYTAQRVSDYNHLTHDNFVWKNGKLFISIIQKKTGNKVVIPASGFVVSMYKKYNGEIPHLWEQHINQYIKVIGKMAGINESVMIGAIKGGRKEQTSYEKWELIHTHTARRTGATLMYQKGMSPIELMAITGHSSIQMLLKYIKISKEEMAIQISDNPFFK